MSAVPQTTPFRAVLGRLTWMLIGPFMLFVITLGMFRRRDGLWDLSDLGYLVGLLAMVLGRWIEFQSGHGLTAYGEPVNASQVRRFTMTAIAAGLVVWAAVTGVRVFVFTV
jgi:hypothetical protein